jgi:predicted hydrolase (HD superfamily)
MNINFTRDEALALLKKYNKEKFHIEHALTLEGVMGWYARELGYGEEEQFWRMAGLLHDIDFEVYPAEHCKKAPELLAELNAGDALVHAVCSHAYGICSDVEPIHEMEKVLFAVDELTGLIGAGVLMRPSKTVMDMEADSVKRKFKDKHFAAGCSRDIIRTGAERLGWELNDLFAKTILGMRDCEANVRAELAVLEG